MNGLAAPLLAATRMADPTAPAEIGAFLLALAGALLITAGLASRATTGGWRWVVRATAALSLWLILSAYWVWAGRPAGSVLCVLSDLLLIAALISITLSIGEFDAAPGTLVDDPDEAGV